jgi:hypothetical protein
MSRKVILLELTCCAEEGVKAAQLRKQVRDHERAENINSSKWDATLLTIEVGARGLEMALSKPSSSSVSLPKRPPPSAKHFR